MAAATRKRRRSGSCSERGDAREEEPAMLARIGIEGNIAHGQDLIYILSLSLSICRKISFPCMHRWLVIRRASQVLGS
jgi:hypothetical protein